MTNIVERPLIDRLRGGDDEASNTNLAHEAADLIESLQARIKELEVERDAFRAARDYEKEAHQRTIKNHDRHYNIAHCGSVDSFLACDDEVKRGYFAMMVEESTDNKKLRERVTELEEENSKMVRIMMMTEG